MDSLHIRFAEEKDVKQITEMDHICFDLPWSEQSFFQEIAGNNLARYFVAELSGKIVGYAGIWLIHDEGHITNIAVHPDFRRRGIAKELFFAIAKVAEDAGVEAYTLEVRISNESAISLYKGLGFVDYGIRKNYYEDNNEDAVIMWKNGKRCEE